MPLSSGASTLSRSSTMQSIGIKVRNMAHYGQPHIEIHLNASDGPRRVIPSYSTMDSIDGVVEITAAHDTRFEDIDIAFVGTSQVFVDRLTTSPTMTGRTEATHRFLLLRQPINESDFPSPRIFEAGRTYRFPFTFNIPEQLLPKACPHNVTSDHVRNMHLQLPPSLGEPDLAGFGSTLLDDMAPEMSKIVYAVKVRIAHTQGAQGISILAEKVKKVRVKPAFEEQAPLNVDNNPEYRAQQEKNLKKGLFKGKLGTLTAKTVQPKPLVIPGARSTDNKPITTISKLVLRFDPADEGNEPPSMGSLATKVKVLTYYASAARRSFPSQSALGFDLSQGLYYENVSLSTLCIASAQWEKHSASASYPAANNAFRRDSGISDCSTSLDSDEAFAAGILPASKNYKQGTFYTAQILVPVTLPMNKNFIPTFHSCLISRTYTLSLQFSVHNSVSSFHLKVPVQICAQGSETGIENARARSVEETVFRDAADVFRPRSFAPPDMDSRRSGSVGLRDDLPPDYSAFAPPAARYSQRVSLVA